MDDSVEESVVAKSTGQQEEKDVALKDAALYSVLSSKKKMTKHEAAYKKQEEIQSEQTEDYYKRACIKCMPIFSKSNIGIKKIYPCH